MTPYAAQVVDLLTKAWAAGLTREQVLDKVQDLKSSTLSMVSARLVRSGRIYARGCNRQHRLYFHANVPLDLADQAAAEHDERFRAASKQKRQDRNARYKEAAAGSREPAARPKGHRAKDMMKRTARINTLADQYRGTASPKEPAKTAPKVTGMETARKVVGPSCRSRYEVDPQSLSGLSKLPLGVYAEPASRWVSVATDRRAA